MSTTNYTKLLRTSSTQRSDYRRDMFGNKLRLDFERLDREAELKLTAGFDVRRSNRCETCFEFKSRNGSCSCE